MPLPLLCEASEQNDSEKRMRVKEGRGGRGTFTPFCVSSLSLTNPVSPFDPDLPLCYSIRLSSTLPSPSFVPSLSLCISFFTFSGFLRSSLCLILNLLCISFCLCFALFHVFFVPFSIFCPTHGKHVFE